MTDALHSTTARAISHGTAAPEPDLWLDRTFRDRVTGYQGHATAYTFYIGDPIPSVRLTRADQHGKPEDEWISAARLDPVPARPAAGFDRP